MRNAFKPSFCQWALAGVFYLCLICGAAGEEKSAATDPPPKAEENTETQLALRSYLQLQEQLHSTLLTIERSRKEAEAAAKANADVITARLEAIEQNLGAQRIQDANLLQNSNRVTLLSAGILAALGVLAMIFTAWFLLRAMNRLGSVLSAFPSGQTLRIPQTFPFVSPDADLVTTTPVEQSGQRLLAVIDRLEKRVDELEETSNVSPPLHPMPQHNGLNGSSEEIHNSGVDDRSIENGPGKVFSPRAEPTDRISLILGKGQSLLSVDKAQESIACFDEAIALDPMNAEALVKKGTALERLKRWEEAVECYDRAIAADRSMTLAYLYKGGACNKLERFNEALECYEQALRTQQKA